MNPFETELFKKGYVKLQMGSYRTWISKRWHEFFVRRGLVHKNFYKQWCPDTETLPIFIRWLKLYDKAEHDRDYPRSNPLLKKEELEMIQREV